MRYLEGFREAQVNWTKLSALAKLYVVVLVAVPFGIVANGIFVVMMIEGDFWRGLIWQFGGYALLWAEVGILFWLGRKR